MNSDLDDEDGSLIPHTKKRKIDTSASKQTTHSDTDDKKAVVEEDEAQTTKGTDDEPTSSVSKPEPIPKTKLEQKSDPKSSATLSWMQMWVF